MKKFFLLVCLIFVTVILFKSRALYAQSPQWEWVQQAGSEAFPELEEGRSIAVDISGNSLVTGYFSGTATFGDTTLTSAGSKDIFIAKYDPNGNLLWVEQAGGISSDQGRSIAVDDFGNSLVTGSFSVTATFGNTTLTSAGFDDIFIAKYDPNGNLLWVKQAGGTSFEDGRAISVDASGNSLVTGWFNDVAVFGNDTLTGAGNLNDSFIAKYDAGGNFLWVEQAGVNITSKVEAWGIATDASGNCLLTGRYNGPATFGDTTLTSDGDDIFIVKYDANGNLVWVEQVSGTATAEVGKSIVVDGSGNSLVTGDFVDSTTFGDTTLITSSGHGDIFIAKYDANGNFLWVQQAGGEFTNDESFSIAADGSGNSLVTGWFTGNATFGDTTLTSTDSLDIFIAKYDANGNFRWVEQVSGPEVDIGYDITVDAFGNSLVTGIFGGDATFGDTTLTSTGFYDIFVAKLTETTSGIQTASSTPTNFRLQQNYPNPFNPTTTINFDVPHTTNVLLKVYDVLGNEIVILVNEELSPGNYKATFDGSGLSSGVYFYRMQAGDFVAIKKLVLQK